MAHAVHAVVLREGEFAQFPSNDHPLHGVGQVLLWVNQQLAHQAVLAAAGT